MDEFPDHLDLAVGQEWTVVLPGLGTAGYMWKEQVSGPLDVIEVSWSRGFAPGTEPAAVGVSAPETATIRALGPGDVTLNLVQVRPWERDVTPNSERRMTVRVSLPASDLASWRARLASPPPRDEFSLAPTQTRPR